jgi:hypothetical protein
MDNRLAYIDQTFLLSLRALEHGPIGQFTWVYEHDVDLEALRRFHRNLSNGLLGRRVERSPIPFGRHSWVTWSSPPELEVASVVRSRVELKAWMDEQAERWVDPEYGPPWRLVVQPLTEGGAAISFVCSHTVADGVGMTLAVIDAVNGTARQFGYPEPNSRSKAQAIREDLRTAMRSAPDIVNAVRSLPRAARDAARWKASTEAPGDSGAIPRQRRSSAYPAALKAAKRTKRDAIKRHRYRPVRMHWEVVRVATAEWDQRAKALGGTSNSLFLAVAARIAQALGNVGPDGSVNCAIPVNERVPNDERGNALTGLPLTVDPDAALTDLTPVRAALKTALSELGENPNAFSGPLALTPLIPKVLARGIELVGLKNAAVTCTNLGDIDPAVNRPDGTDAEYFSVRGRIAHLECRTSFIQRSGDYMPPLSAGRINGSVFVVPGYATTDPSFPAERFRELVAGVLTDFGLSATFD